MRNGLVGLGVLLIAIWVVGFIVFKVAGFLIHLLILIGIVMLVAGLLRRVRGPRVS